MDLLTQLQWMQKQPRQERPRTETPPAECWKKTVLRPLEEFPGAFELPQRAVRLMEASELPPAVDPTRILYLDTETTGLSGGAGTLVFQIGLGRLTPEGFRIDQRMIRDYPEERALLEATAEALADCDVICTFNGRTFDLPLLRSRMILQRLPVADLDKPHIDLLHIARRVFKLRLQQCNLGRLEEKLLGIRREDDLPGSEVPERFFTYLRTGRFELLEDVLRHNEQDIASLCVLLNHMASLYHQPEQLTFGEDLLSMGNGLERYQHPEEARYCWSLVPQGPAHAQSRLQLAASYRRSGDREAAVKIWQDLARHHEGGIEPWVELAKYYEHTARDLPRALSCTRHALAQLAEPSLFPRETVQFERNALQYRYARLQRKLSGSREEQQETGR